MSLKIETIVCSRRGIKQEPILLGNWGFRMLILSNMVQKSLIRGGLFWSRVRIYQIKDVEKMCFFLARHEGLVYKLWGLQSQEMIETFTYLIRLCPFDPNTLNQMYFTILNCHQKNLNVIWNIGPKYNWFNIEIRRSYIFELWWGCFRQYLQCACCWPLRSKSFVEVK